MNLGTNAIIALLLCIRYHGKMRKRNPRGFLDIVQIDKKIYGGLYLQLVGTPYDTQRIKCDISIYVPFLCVRLMSGKEWNNSIYILWMFGFQQKETERLMET